MLTSEQVRASVANIKTDPETIGPIARAIESAATKPLLERIAALEAANVELERLCDATYCATGADAYNHACDEMERWQKQRDKSGLQVGTLGSLCDGISWLYGYIAELEAKLAQQAEAQEPCAACITSVAGAGPNDVSIQWRGGFARKGELLYRRPQTAQLEQLTQRVTELEKALFEALSAFAEVYHATTRPDWFTKGKGAALQHSLMWQKKGAAVVKAALESALAAKNGAELK